LAHLGSTPSMGLPRLVCYAANAIRARIGDEAEPQCTADELPAIRAGVPIGAGAGIRALLVSERHSAVVDSVFPPHHERVAFYVSEDAGCVKRQRVRIGIIAANGEWPREGTGACGSKRQQ
jgi:hypothetical protein